MNKEAIEVMEEQRQMILDLERANAQLRLAIQRQYKKISELIDQLPDHHPEKENLPKCDGCGATGVPLETSMFGNPEYCQSSGDFCKDCR
jgi:hypothetical protein